MTRRTKKFLYIVGFIGLGIAALVLPLYFLAVTASVAYWLGTRYVQEFRRPKVRRAIWKSPNEA